MSGWVLFVFVILGVFGRPDVRITGRYSGWLVASAWGAWAVVMLALLFAVVIDAKGWP